MGETQLSDIKRISDKVTIATTTFYNFDSEHDIYRAGIAKNVVKTAKDLGYEFVIVDGGSPDELLEDFENSRAKVFAEQTKGMGASRRQAIKEAYNLGRRVIAWTEPEKESYISQIAKTAQPILQGSADLVVPKRKSLESYPTAQQYAEPIGNAFWRVLTGSDLDVWFGPRTWKKEVSNHFLDYNGKHGDKWDSIFIPVMDVILAGKRVVGVEVDYTHPQKQTEMEENDPVYPIKRLQQLENLIPALESHMRR